MKVLMLGWEFPPHISGGLGTACGYLVASGLARAFEPLFTWRSLWFFGLPTGLAIVILIAAFSCTGLGLTSAAISLRVRENAVLSNVIFGFLLIFTGANVPISELPTWMQDVSHVIPLTHAIQAARDLAAGEAFSDVTGLLATELGIGLTYLAGGLVLLRVFEWQGRKHATLEQL